MAALEDFVGVFVVNAAARDAMLNAADIRGQTCFNAMQPYAATPGALPVTLANMLDTYTLDADAVQDVMRSGGQEMWQFLTAMAAVTVVVEGPTLNNTLPNVYTAGGTWEGGTVITFTLELTDPAGDQDIRSVVVTLPPGQHSGATVASVCAQAVDPSPHVRAVAAGNTLTLSATDMDYSLDSSASVT